jgi:hypothetical protein
MIKFLIALIATSLMATSIQAAETIGRLFTSPAERQNLEYLRQTRKANTPIVPTDIEAPVLEAAPAPIVLPDAINMQGYVKRNDGKKGTVWVNDLAMQENTRNKDVMVGKLPQNGNRIPIKLPANGKRLTIKAGQVYEPESNKIREARNNAAQGDNGVIGE